MLVKWRMTCTRWLTAGLVAASHVFIKSYYCLHAALKWRQKNFWFYLKLLFFCDCTRTSVWRIRFLQVTECHNVVLTLLPVQTLLWKVISWYLATWLCPVVTAESKFYLRCMFPLRPVQVVPESPLHFHTRHTFTKGAVSCPSVVWWD